MKLRTQVTVNNDDKLSSDITDAGKTATTYLTHIDGTSGISVHDANDTSNYINITSGFINLVTSGVSRLAAYIENNVAKIRVGMANANRFMVNDASLQGYDSNNNKYFEVSANGLTYGTSTAASTDNVAAAKNEASKVATDYLTNITGSGICVHDATDTSNYVNITSGLINMVTSGVSKLAAYVESGVAKVRVGASAGMHVLLDTAVKIMDGSTSLAEFGIMSSSSNVTINRVINKRLHPTLVVNELDPAPNGATITADFLLYDPDTGGSFTKTWSLPKGTSDTYYAIGYDGDKTFSYYSDYFVTLLRIKCVWSVRSRILRLGDTGTNDKAIVIGDKYNGKNADRFSVDITGNITSVGKLDVSNVGYSNTIGASGEVSTDLSTSNGVWKALASFTLEAGVYICTAYVHFNASNTGIRRVGISATSADTSCTKTQANPPSSNSMGVVVPVTQILCPTSATTYYINAYQNSGSALGVSKVEWSYVQIK